MTLAQRLLVAIGALSIATIFALGFGVRQALRYSEEKRFRDEFARALGSLRPELSEEIGRLPKLIEPLCRHDPLVDSALVGLESQDLDTRRLALAARVPELAQSLPLDELCVVTSSGELLGARPPSIAARAASIARYLEHAERATLRTSDTVAVEYGCVHRSRENKKLWVGVYAARDLAPLLAKIGASYNLALSFEPIKSSEERMADSLTLPELDGKQISAERSRVPLLSALEDFDVTISLIGVGTLLAALVLSLLLSRSLTRPLSELAREAGAVVHGEPKPVIARGGREIVAFADAFNRAIADLAALRKRLAATERIAARREIARRVAHEIKNPLAPIRAAVETLRRLRSRQDPAFDGYFDEATRTVLDEVARITNIVGEFTRFARLPAPNPGPLDLAELLRGLVALHAASGPPIELVCEPCPIVQADRDQIVQLVTNLLQNAQHAAAASGAGKVNVELRPQPADHVTITVRDNGPGLAPEMRDRLFEPYATTKAEGTGLGLAIAQRIALEHGGDLSYRDAPGGGAVFEARLPVSGPTLLAEPPPSEG